MSVSGAPKSVEDTRLSATVASARGRVARQVALVVALGVAGWAFVAVTEHPVIVGDGVRIDRMTANGCDYDTAADPGREHLIRPIYTVEPPAGGPHLREAAQLGVYSAEAAPPDGALVHAMEHGGVIVWLGPALDDTDAARARALHAAYPTVVAVVDRPRLTSPIVATAWHRRLVCRTTDIGSVRRFICAFNGRGPERTRAQVSRGCRD
jgi:hypothetical protein